MAMIYVDGVAIKDPSVMTPSRSDISGSDAGRTEDLIMHKNRKGSKYKIELAWNNPTPEETKAILQAFEPEYFNFKFTSPLTNAEITISAYRGDWSAPVQQWYVGGKRYSQVKLDVIER